MNQAIMQKEASVSFQDTGARLERVEKKIGFVQAAKVGKTLYISGSVRWHQKGSTFAAEEMQNQLRHAFRDIREMLSIHGATPADILKETVYTKNIEAAIEAETIRDELYGAQSPDTKWIGVSRLLYPELLIEINIVARLP